MESKTDEVEETCIVWVKERDYDRLVYLSSAFLSQ